MTITNETTVAELDRELGKLGARCSWRRTAAGVVATVSGCVDDQVVTAAEFGASLADALTAAIAVYRGRLAYALSTGLRQAPATVQP